MRSIIGQVRYERIQHYLSQTFLENDRYISNLACLVRKDLYYLQKDLEDVHPPERPLLLDRISTYQAFLLLYRKLLRTKTNHILYGERSLTHDLPDDLSTSSLTSSSTSSSTSISTSTSSSIASFFVSRTIPLSQPTISFVNQLKQVQ